MLVLKEFNLEHLDMIDLKEGQEICSFKNPKVELESLYYNSLAVTAFKEGRVYCIVGLYRHWKGMYESWAFLSKESAAKPIGFIRLIYGLLNDFRKRNDNWQIIQAIALDTIFNAKLYKMLGFKKEGRFSRYFYEKRRMRIWSISRR